jgi:phosphoglycerol transferase
MLIRVILGILLALLVPIAGTILTAAPVIWPISTLIYNLGLLYSFAIAPKSATRIISYNIVAAIFFVIEASFFFSYYLQDAGFNEAFFYHIRPDLVHAGVGEHLPILLGMLVCLCGLLVLFSSVLAKETPTRTWLSPIALGLLAVGLFISPPMQALILHAKSFSPDDGGRAVFDDFRELLGPKVTVHFSESQRPNIILIYAEGLNQRYFDEAVFPSLLPNLKRLREQSVDFSNVAQGIGADWTVAGMVASQCGYPLAKSYGISEEELSIFSEFLPRATCLGDLLQQDGYRLTFIGGADARFAGKRDFLRSHGYDEIIDRDVLLGSLADQSYRNWWGAYDDTMFDFAFKKFGSMSRGEKPFLMTLLTIDTHHPNGFLSGSCGTYGAGDNSILNSVHCSDLLIARFIGRVRTSPYSGNTVIIVLSDHLANSNRASDLLASSNMPDRLTFFINTPDEEQGKNRNPGVHYDIAPTILDFIGYNISGQLGLGTPLTRGAGYLAGKFGEDTWQEQKANLLAIGGTLWDTEVTLDQEGMKLLTSKATLTVGKRNFNLRSRGSSNVPASIALFFDENSLKLLEIKCYPFNQELIPETLDDELLKHKTNLALVISRAGFLPGFVAPGIDPRLWVYFFGKPGGHLFSQGPIDGDLTIPFKMILEMDHSELDEQLFHQREELVKAMKKKHAV